MSSEVEPGKDPEDTKVDHKRTFKQKINDYWQIGLKVLELLFCIVCLIFAYDAVRTSGLGSSHMNHIGIMFASFTGFFMINVLLVLNRFFGERMPYRSAAIYSLIGSALFLITGILLIVCRTFLMKHYGYTSEMSIITNLTLSLFFSFVNTLVFAFDSIYTFKRMDDF
ncbi:uncharacterized protein LOC123316759 isoform X2 [Coccinella septempunctata]|uniref:uncharacterized protein LOC123316759 isoform X2 n=1 Tax=Coccinella septempunctata TaxID=41139 RepID=UPI001D086D56|nr:uncharacterized protein LOC123316759 isoform X2 [Coccinella septempunctata]